MTNVTHPLDIIRVDNLRLWSHVGVLDHEREHGQWFRVDLELHLDLNEFKVNFTLKAML